MYVIVILRLLILFSDTFFDASYTAERAIENVEHEFVLLNMQIFIFITFQAKKKKKCKGAFLQLSLTEKTRWIHLETSALYDDEDTRFLPLTIAPLCKVRPLVSARKHTARVAWNQEHHSGLVFVPGGFSGWRERVFLCERHKWKRSGVFFCGAYDGASLGSSKLDIVFLSCHIAMSGGEGGSYPSSLPAAPVKTNFRCGLGKFATWF